MRLHRKLGVVLLVGFSSVMAGQSREETKDTSGAVSYKEKVLPIVNKYCLPCHAAESENRSQLSLDSYALIMAGGKHGPAVMIGKPEESLLIQKLSEKPPFGDMMPLARRRQSKEPPRRLTAEELKILADWIAQGAKEN